MKATMMIKPLVFAIAATMATTTMANRWDNDDDDDEVPVVTDATIQTTWLSGAHATIENSQTIRNNDVGNQATENTAKVTESANGSAGNLGINSAAGDVNQQANEAALATADESFLFGHSVASISVDQTSRGNSVSNYSTQNKATISNVGNGAEGNIGVNVTAGNFNQQKNAMAAAVSGGRHVSASAGATQSVSGASVSNEAQIETVSQDVSLNVGLLGGYVGVGGGVINDEKPVAVENNVFGADPIKSDKDTDTFGFIEAGGILLGGVATGSLPVSAAVTQAVVNNATLTNSLNGASGNIGANVSAGSHNQQVNSLSIAAGCNACAAK